MRIRTLALALGAFLTASTLTGCVMTGPNMGGMNPPSDAPSAGSSSDVNAADQMFTMGMIVHHEQAIEMADLLLAKSGVDPRVVELAGDIKAAQQPEIDLMSGWLRTWGLAIPDAMGHGDMEHDGMMMSDDDMRALEAATGDEAAALFLDQMIEHHEGAIEMAEGVLAAGRNTDVLDLARAIIETQTAEIELMRTIRADL